MPGWQSRARRDWGAWCTSYAVLGTRAETAGECLVRNMEPAASHRPARNGTQRTSAGPTTPGGCLRSQPVSDLLAVTVYRVHSVSGCLCGPA